ncbi:MAG: hypothetical protein ACRCZ0_07250, partial [Cetobacterium sp.]
MEMFGMEFQFVDDVEKVKNRENMSELLIFTAHPQLFLESEVAHPEEVKHLTINQYLDYDDDPKLWTKITEYYKKHPNVVLPPSLDSDKECANIVNFHNIEVFKARDLKLTSDLWLQFINNCKNLKEIDFSAGDPYNSCDDFEFEEKTEVLDALFQLSTLETVKMWCNWLWYFPPGPSNIKYLELEGMQAKEGDFSKLLNSWKTNFSTHTNIKYLRLAQFKNSPFQLKDLNLGKMESLEEIVLEEWEIDSDCFESILMLPNLKRIELLTWFSYHIPKILDIKNL